MIVRATTASGQIYIRLPVSAVEEIALMYLDFTSRGYSEPVRFVCIIVVGTALLVEQGLGDSVLTVPLLRLHTYV